MTQTKPDTLTPIDLELSEERETKECGWCVGGHALDDYARPVRHGEKKCRECHGTGRVPK